MIKVKNEIVKYILYVFAVVLLVYAGVSLAIMLSNIYNISVSNNSYNEVRDYVSFRLTHLILEGKNPYTLDNLTELNVPFMCLYTLLYPALVAAACKITGFSVMEGYYFVNILLYLLTAYHVWMIVRNYFKESKWIGIPCVLINSATFFSLFGLPVYNFHTDTVGIYVTSLIFLIVHKNKKSTLPLAVLSVLLIFTKQILVVMVIPLFIFYLIKDGRLALKYMVECIICGIIALATVQAVFPLYWTETIYTQFFVSKNYGSILHAGWNIVCFYFRYIMYMILILTGAIASIVIRTKNGYKFSPKGFVRELVDQEEYAVYLILNLIFGTIFLLYFAKCGGDGYKYCQDILAPSCFLLLIYVWNGYFARYFRDYRKGDIDLKKVLIITILCASSVITYFQFQSRYYTTDDIEAYQEFDRELAEHEGQKMYLGMNSTQYLLNRDIWEPSDIYFNDGQIEYFNGDYPDIFINEFFYDEEIGSAAAEYVDRINCMVENKEFGVITTCLDNIIMQDILENNYSVYKTYKIKTDTNGIYDVTLWLPLK